MLDFLDQPLDFAGLRISGVQDPSSAEEHGSAQATINASAHVP